MHADHLNSSAKTTDAEGILVETKDYFPYGKPRISDSSISDRKGYIGQDYDTDTTLSYLNARYYDGERGQFTSQDIVFQNLGVDERTDAVLVNPQALNSYAYALGNPVLHSDPSGEIAPLLLVAWAVAEVGLAAWDAVDLVQTLGDNNATSTEKLTTGGLFLIGAIAPGGGYTKADNIAKNASDVGRKFDAVKQQQKMLKGIENSKAINTIKATFKTSDEVPGGTMGALRNEINTGNATKNIFHTGKARNTINRIQNIFKTESLNKVESSRLEGISNSLKSLIKNVKNQ